MAADIAQASEVFLSIKTGGLAVKIPNIVKFCFASYNTQDGEVYAADVADDNVYSGQILDAE